MSRRTMSIVAKPKAVSISGEQLLTRTMAYRWHLIRTCFTQRVRCSIRYKRVCSCTTVAAPLLPATMANTFEPSRRSFMTLSADLANGASYSMGTDTTNSTKRSRWCMYGGKGSTGWFAQRASNYKILRCKIEIEKNACKETAMVAKIGHSQAHLISREREASAAAFTSLVPRRRYFPRRPVIMQGGGAKSLSESKGQAVGDLPCRGEGPSRAEGTCLRNFRGLLCIPLSLGVTPRLQEGKSFLSKTKTGCAEDKVKDFSSASTEEALLADSASCAAEGEEASLSAETPHLSVISPDQGSYAAMLYQKVTLEVSNTYQICLPELSSSSVLNMYLSAQCTYGKARTEGERHHGDLCAALCHRLSQSAGRTTASDLVNCLTDFLLLFKTAVDVPWAVALPLLGAAVRLTTLPFAISSERDIRLRAVYQEEITALQRGAQEAKANGFGSPEFKKAQKRLNTFLKKHDLSAIPLSIFQALLVGIVISLTTPAIRNISGRSNEFPHFAVEHPAWVESLALPDPTPLTAFLGTYGMLSLMMAGWLVSDKIAKALPQQRPPSSPVLTRIIPGIVASCMTIYAGLYVPTGAMFMLLPAAGIQAVLTRIFRTRAVERIFSKIRKCSKKP